MAEKSTPPSVPIRLLLALAAAGACSGGDDDEVPPDAGPERCAEPDADGDGAPMESCGGEDCDDTRADVHPGADDDTGDGEDQNCDGADGVDADDDGHASVTSGGDDCDDGHETIHPGAPEDDWVTEVVDDGQGSGAEDAGTYPSLTVDAEGADHIAYQVDLTRTPPRLYHATRRQEVWQFEAIDEDLEVVGNGRGAGWYGSIVADRSGTLHVSYVADWGRQVRYARNDGGAWAIELVQTIAFPVADTSLALDPVGQPHIAYYDQRDTRLWYASPDGGAWTFEPVTTEDDTGAECSLAIDGDGVAHVALRAEAGALLYATNATGAFEVEVVDDADDAGRAPSIALDPQGAVQIAYVSDAGVRVARGRAGDFTIETVEAGRSFSGSSLAVDAQGVSHLAYHQEAGVGLRYATNPRASWTLATVEPDSDAGRHASIALDPAGQPRIAYLALGAQGSVLGFAHVRSDRVDTNCDGLDW